MAKIDDSVKKKVPELRFKGFTDDWEQRKLSNESTITAGGDIDKSKLKEVGEYPIFANALTNDGTVGYYDSYYRVEAPAVTVTGRGDVGHAKARKVNFTPVVRLLAVKSNHDVDFLENAINNHKVLVESTGVPQLTAPQLGNYKIFFPTGEEQQKIGSFFKQLDDTIALHQRKLDLLKEQKKGFLQKMFPKNGAKVPELRFAGFADDWEERKFDECFNFPVSTNSLSRALLNYDEGDIQSVHYGDILIKYPAILNVKNDKIPYITDSSFEKYKSNLLENGDLIFADAAEDETVGKAVEVNGLTEENLVAGLHTIVARSKDKKAEFFLGYYINSNTYHRQLLRLIQGSKVSSISKGNLQKTLVSFPKDFEEQQKIGYFFKQLDDTIALHQRKLDLLKEQKKGFLQKMFV
ncbi:restriction endonuclease subunit S [Leuconostoc falkenbergense]|uniref:Restriction endonuclease subunit S n=1 Tax=Leuconostoc falkenbergense TaxID=2766470 RepID=A0ABT7S1G3_9LACO|nr:restriction endonuclease subunit S [Leuconostoc falkenbergense]MDM7647417.1 restriction endonuclease subunit S [Leuconostoc falkenbergense]